MCPTSVLGHGHQWLLPTRVSGGHPPPLLQGLHYFWTAIKTTRSDFHFWRNIYFFFNHTSTSAKFIPGNPVPKILQGLYFSNFIIPDCFLFPPAFSLRLLLALSRCIWRLKEKKEKKSSLSKKSTLIDTPNQNLMKPSSFSMGCKVSDTTKARGLPATALSLLEKRRLTNRNHVWNRC